MELFEFVLGSDNESESDNESKSDNENESEDNNDIQVYDNQSDLDTDLILNLVFNDKGEIDYYRNTYDNIEIESNNNNNNSNNNDDDESGKHVRNKIFPTCLYDWPKDILNTILFYTIQHKDALYNLSITCKTFRFLIQSNFELCCEYIKYEYDIKYFYSRRSPLSQEYEWHNAVNHHYVQQIDTCNSWDVNAKIDKIKDIVCMLDFKWTPLSAHYYQKCHSSYMKIECKSRISPYHSFTMIIENTKRDKKMFAIDDDETELLPNGWKIPKYKKPVIFNNNNNIIKKFQTVFLKARNLQFNGTNVTNYINVSQQYSRFRFSGFITVPDSISLYEIYYNSTTICFTIQIMLYSDEEKKQILSNILSQGNQNQNQT